MKNTRNLYLVIIFVTGTIIGVFIASILFQNSEEISLGSAEFPEAAASRESPHADHEEGVHELDPVHLSEDELKEFDITIGTAKAGVLSMHTDLTGIIRIDPELLAHITPRYSGIVNEVRVKSGDLVKKGEILAIIESNESLAPYEMRSLIDGTIISMHLTKGEVITDTDHEIVVADLQHVWVDLNVYQKDLDVIRIGQRARISVGTGYPDVHGSISYISPVVDEDTRTAIARVVLTNRDRDLRPGLFVTAHVITKTVSVPVALPKTALQTHDGKTVIFIQSDAGFIPQSITLGISNDSLVAVTSGLKVGERYVAKGGFTIKAELEKSSLGEGHEH